MALLGFISLVGLLALQTSVLAQSGFISIDCGMASEDSTYEDNQTRITYVSDSQFIDTGINKNIASDFMTTAIRPRYETLRSFPNGSRNCYTLRPDEANGKKFLIRAYFLYGNYDGENQVPVFDLYVGTDHWWSVNLTNASITIYTEIIMMTAMDYVSVCLVNTGNGTPFISALELRPLHDSMYPPVNESSSLVLHARNDCGSTLGVRYPDDSYDRIWDAWDSFTPWVTSADVVDNIWFKPPPAVMKTAVLPVNGTNFISFGWEDDTDSDFYLFMYFAEFDTKAKWKRIFNITLNGDFWVGNIVPRYLQADTVYSTEPVRGQRKYAFNMTQPATNTYPPMLNAYEICYLKKLSHSSTDNQDVTSIMSIKEKYGVRRNWMGDPCLPRYFPWDGLECNYNDSNPRIISLNLSYAGLSGEIAADLIYLKSIESLDLSSNQFEGTLPMFLLERSKNGLLSLSVDNNPNLCRSEPCAKKKKKNNLLVILVPVISAAAILLLIGMIFIWRRWSAARPIAKVNRNYHLTNQRKLKDRMLSLENRNFTYNEVVRMTDNFERVLGKGGFGTVYDGHMTDGTHVAVKLLSQSSSQGLKEFKTEAVLLMRIHHRNLVSFIGYCYEGKEMALIYEYMSEGNLRQHLSGTDSRANALHWGQRLQIALDVAQGLEYLHNGCKPPIIHRDVKSANILLNESLDAKIADFGLCKFFTREDLTHMYTTVKGTLGYLDPEYYIYQKLNEKSDVYSFGIVLLELITGKPAIVKISSSEKLSIVLWANNIVESGDIRNLVDPRLQGDYDINSVWKATEIAMECTLDISNRRPTMSNIVTELKKCLGKMTEPEMTLSMRNVALESSSSSSFNPLPR